MGARGKEEAFIKLYRQEFAARTSVTEDKAKEGYTFRDAAEYRSYLTGDECLPLPKKWLEIKDEDATKCVSGKCKKWFEVKDGAANKHGGATNCVHEDQSRDDQDIINVRS